MVPPGCVIAFEPSLLVWLLTHIPRNQGGCFDNCHMHPYRSLTCGARRNDHLGVPCEPLLAELHVFLGPHKFCFNRGVPSPRLRPQPRSSSNV